MSATKFGPVVEAGVRALLCHFLSVVFTTMSVAFLLAHGAHGFLETPDGIQERAEESDLRGLLVTWAADEIAKEIAKDPSLVPMSGPELRLAVGVALSPLWLKETISRVHAALGGVYRQVEEESRLELAELKAGLRTSIVELRAQVENNCAEYFGGAVCQDAVAATAIASQFERYANASVSQIRDEIDLLKGLGPKERKSVEQLRGAAESIESLSMVALLLAIFSFAFLCLLNLARPVQLLRRLGRVLAVSAFSYTLLGYVLSKVVGFGVGSFDMPAFLHPLIEMLIRDATLANWPLALAMGATGIAMIGASFILPDRG